MWQSKHSGSAKVTQKVYTMMLHTYTLQPIQLPTSKTLRFVEYIQGRIKNMK